MRGAAVPVCRARYPCITHPSATKPSSYCYFKGPVRLACLSHAASVRSEPGSNSSLFIVAPDAGRSLHPVCFDERELIEKNSFVHENVDRDRLPAMQVPDLSHTLPAGRSGLSSPDRLCCCGSAATVSGIGAAHVLTAFVTLFTCQRARYTPCDKRFRSLKGSHVS